MKHTLLYIATTLLLAACQQEELPLGKQALGYLYLSEVSMEASDVQLISTRAEEDEPLIVELLQGKEVKYSKIYTDGMTLSCAPGSYTLQIRSESYGTDESAAKYYYWHGPVEVKEGETTPIEEPIEVPMVNFGVTFSWPEDLKGFTKIKFNVEYGSTSKEIQTGETVYFDISDGKIISYSLSAKNEDMDPVFTKGSYGDEENETLKAGTIYTVSYKLETQTLEIK